MTSREAVINLTKEFLGCFVNGSCRELFRDKVNELPSVQPSRKGHLIANELIEIICNKTVAPTPSQTALVEQIVDIIKEYFEVEE